MSGFPKGVYSSDIFTEADGSDDTLAELGPLRGLAGTWQGERGRDVSPKADGPETTTYREEWIFEPIDRQVNGPQLLYGLRYHQHVNKFDEELTFHDQVGYLLWEPAAQAIYMTLAIPPPRAGRDGDGIGCVRGLDVHSSSRGRGSCSGHPHKPVVGQPFPHDFVGDRLHCPRGRLDQLRADHHPAHLGSGGAIRSS